MTQPAVPAVPAAAQKPGRTAIIVGAILAVVGVVMLVVGVVGVVTSGVSIASAFTTQQVSPATFTRHLEGGSTYLVYQLADDPTGTITTEVTPADVLVSGPSPVTVTSATLTETYSQQGATFRAVASFVPSVSGSYTVRVTADGAVVLLGPSLVSFVRVAPWAGLAGLGGLLALAGLVTLIVGAVLRSRRPRAAGPYPGYAGAPGYAYPVAPAQAVPMPMPGWYADPGRPGGQRYWDGTRWTEHVA